MKNFKRNILITGGAGFIGSHVIRLFVNKYPEYKVINLDSLTYAGNLANLKDVEDNPNYLFVKADICDFEKMQNIFKEHVVDSVIHLAAESHVDRSIKDPFSFAKTNIMGTLNLLEAARKEWKDSDGSNLFYHVSTDEVYGTLGKTGMFTETTPIKPNSPYSASKAASDLIVRAYNETFKMPVNITRCSNNYGPYQFPEKLIPLMINNCINDRQLPVYGDGMQIRDWLHVKDHCQAIETVLRKGKDGEVYNIGGNNEKANIEIVKLIIETLGKDESLIKYVEDRLGHDRRYAIDNTKITSELGWAPKYTFEQGMKETIDWYLENSLWLDRVISKDYMAYYDKMYSDK